MFERTFELRIRFRNYGYSFHGNPGHSATATRFGSSGDAL